MIPNLWKREQEFVNVINDLECRGIGLDPEFARRKLAIGESRTHNLLQEIGYNPGSSKQLKTLLIDQLGLPVLKPSKKTGEPSFDKFAMAEYEQYLENMGSPLAKQILEYRGWSKTNGYYKSYLTLVGPDGRLRPHFKMHGTETGRLSASEPNSQQVPKESTKEWNGDMKQTFIPMGWNGLCIPGGYGSVQHGDYGLLNVDYGQLELRLAAAYSGEPILLEAFNDPTRHVFKEMSALLGISYNQCKTATYAILYGAQIPKVASILQLGPERAVKFSEDWYSTYPKLMAMSEKVNSIAASRGYIKYWSGRRRHFPDRRDARKAFNSLLQGGGAEVVKSAMIRVSKKVESKLPYRMLLQVHDSIVGEAKMSEIEEITQAIQYEMCNVIEEHDFGVTFTAEADFWGPKIER